MQSLPDGCVNLIFADPPYNIGKASWDKIENYHEWNARWIQEASRILASNGAFWVSHSEPEQLILMSQLIAGYGRERKNWITWDKYNGCNNSGKLWAMNKSKINPKSKRAVDRDAEFIIFHANEDGWVTQSDDVRGFIFEPLRAYLDGERKRAGVDKADCNAACGFSHSPGGMASRHYFSRSQWCLPTKEHYEALQRLFGTDYLTREYESLRTEYEHLRYTFHNPGKVSSVWQFAPVSSEYHPTPKPDGLLDRIISMTSNPGDIFYEPFAGSATGCKVADKLGRKWFATELEREYVEKASQEIEDQQRQLQLL